MQQRGRTPIRLQIVSRNREAELLKELEQVEREIRGLIEELKLVTERYSSFQRELKKLQSKAR